MKKIKFLFITLILIFIISIGNLLVAASENPDEPSTDFEMITYLQTEDVKILSTMGNEFSDKAVVTANKITDAKKLMDYKNELGENANKMVVYEISAKENGNEVPPGGTLGMTFALPEDFEIEKTLILFMTSEGKYTIMPCRKGGSVSITTFSDTLGTYILVETVNPITLTDFFTSYDWGIESVTPAPTKGPEKDNERPANLAILITAGAFSIIALGVLVIFLCHKKKKYSA